MWLSGPPGCGKSYIARVKVPKLLGIKDVVLKSPDSKWWPSDCTKTDYVVLEDLDSNFKNIGFGLLKLWGDEYPFNAEIKGGMVSISPRIVVVTSNYSLE